MQDIFIRIIFGILILSVVSKFYSGTKKLLDEVHFIIVLVLILIMLTLAYFTGGLLIK